MNCVPDLYDDYRRNVRKFQFFMDNDLASYENIILSLEVYHGVHGDLEPSDRRKRLSCKREPLERGG